MTEPGIWEQIGEAVLERRLELGLRTREDLARLADLSSRALSDLEKGRRQSYAPGTYAALEKALGWPAGTIRSWIVHGRVTAVPTQEPLMQFQEPPDLSHVPLDELLGEIARRAQGPRERDAAAGDQEPA